MSRSKLALGLALVLIGNGAGRAQDTAPPAPGPSVEAQRDQLLKDVAQLRADLIAAETRLHVCEATSEARQHTTASISELRRANPGVEYVWDQSKLSIVKVEPAKEK